MFLSTGFRKAKTLGQQSKWVQLWLVPTWFLLGISRAVILTVPFKRLAPHLGIQAGVAPRIPLLNLAQEPRALHIGRVVRLAARYTPWDSNCFAQALTARLLLGLYQIPYGFYFGVCRDASTGEMKAHAWVAAGRVRVTGGTSFGQFTVVGCFVSPSAQTQAL